MPHRLPDINLLPKYERQSPHLFYFFIFMMIIILIAYALLGVYYFTTKSKMKTTEAKYEELTAEVDALYLQVNENKTDDNTSIDQAVTYVENFDIPTSTFIVEINDLLPEQGYLSEYAYSNKIADVVAHFETLDSVANYTSQLITSGYLNDTKVNDIDTFVLKEDEEDSEFVHFNIIPRYEADFTLDINKRTLKGEQQLDE